MNLDVTIRTIVFAALLTHSAAATEFHVATSGYNASPGTNAQPLQTISAAAIVAQPGDTITVHAGIYRERVDPPRGNVAYQAAPGEHVVIAGTEQIKGWQHVVFVKGAQPSKFDTSALMQPKFDASIRLEQESDGWYLTFTADRAWRAEARCKLVTTKLLGKPKRPDLPYENSDGSPIRVDVDYFGKNRSTSNPFPGPIETIRGGPQSLKVWPTP